MRNGCKVCKGLPGRKSVKGWFIRMTDLGTFEVTSSQFGGSSSPRCAEDLI